jgi:transcriptional regulator with XRE-family HTH domain
MGFGTMLKAMREKVGLSQAALAERVGVSVRNIQNWEQGHRTPRAQVLLTLARAVGVPVEQLLSAIGRGNPSPGPAKRGRRKAK